MGTFTTQDAVAIIKATKSGIRPPKANPNPDILVENLNRAWMRFNTLTSSLKIIRMSDPVFAEDFKGNAGQIEKKAAELIKLLTPKGKSLRGTAWEEWLYILLLTKEIKLPIKRESLEEGATVIRAFIGEMVDNLLVYVNFLLFRELPFTQAQLLDLLNPWRDKFASIWLLWGGNVLQCTPNFLKMIITDYQE